MFTELCCLVKHKRAIASVKPIPDSAYPEWVQPYDIMKYDAAP